MALGTTVWNTNVDSNQGAFAFYGLRRLDEAADVTLSPVHSCHQELELEL